VNISRFFLLLLCSLFLSGGGVFAASDTADAEVVYKAFPKETVKRLQSSEDYIYPLSQGAQGLTPWQRFKQWLRQFLSFKMDADWWEYLLYLAIFVIFIFAAIKLLGLSFNGVFGAPQKGDALPFKVGEEELGKLDFSSEIAAAVAQHNWRLVVRLRYLQALYILSEKQLVNIKQGKTNFDYLYELKPGKGKEPFAKLANLFEYVWYGDFDAEEIHVAQSENYLKTLVATTLNVQHVQE
jgi:hypothetical protein